MNDSLPNAHVQGENFACLLSVEKSMPVAPPEMYGRVFRQGRTDAETKLCEQRREPPNTHQQWNGISSKEVFRKRLEWIHINGDWMSH